MVLKNIIKKILSILSIEPRVAKKILLIATPSMLGLIIQTSMNWVDTAIIGELEHDVRTAAQSALGLSLPFLWIIGGSLSAMSVGTQAMTARRYGEEKIEEAGKILFNAIILGIFLGTIFTLVGIFIAPLVFPLMTEDPKAAELGIIYSKIRFLCVFPWITAYAYKAFFDGIEKTYVYMVATIIMTILNFILNIGLVFGKWGLPRLEVAGSAWGSTISSYVTLVIMILWSFSPKYRKRFKYYKLTNFNMKYIWRLIKLSAPAGGAVIIAMTGFELFQIIANRLDSPGSSLMGAATWCIIMVASFCFIASTAFGTSTATLVSESMGAKHFDMAEKFGNASAKIGIIIFGIMGIMVLIWPDTFLKIFARDNWEVISVARNTMRLVGIVMFFIPPALIYSQALFGAGNTKFVMIVEGILHTCCLVPLSYLFGIVLNLGLLGIFLSAFTYAFLLAVIMGWKFRAAGWKKIVI